MLTSQGDDGNCAECSLIVCHMSNRGQQSVSLSDASDSSQADNECVGVRLGNCKADLVYDYCND